MPGQTNEDILAGQCRLASAGSHWTPTTCRACLKPLRLDWDTGQVAAGQSFDLLVALPQANRRNAV